LVVLVRRHCHAVRAAVRRAVDDEISSAIKEETGPRSFETGAMPLASTPLMPLRRKSEIGHG